MAFSLEIYELVQRYAKESHNRDVTLQELRAVPWHKIVATWWDAQVHFGMNGFYRSLDDVKEPKPGMNVSIRTKTGLDTYTYKRGEWVFTGDLSESMYKE